MGCAGTIYGPDALSQLGAIYDEVWCSLAEDGAAANAEVHKVRDQLAVLVFDLAEGKTARCHRNHTDRRPVDAESFGATPAALRGGRWVHNRKRADALCLGSTEPADRQDVPGPPRDGWLPRAHMP